MRDNLLVSIIVPIYRVEAYLDECVTSIVGQSYTNLEILLVDDGSPDACPAMCDAWAERDARVRVIHKANGGLSDARNAGIEQARGEWLMFIDSDDVMLPDMCARLLAAATERQAEIAQGNFYFYTCQADGSWQCSENITATPSGGQVLTGVEAVRRCMGPGASTDDVVAWSKIYHRSLFQSEPCLRYPVGRLHEDMFTTYKILYKASKVAYIDTPLYYYRQRAGSIMAQYGLQNVEDTLAYILDYHTWPVAHAPTIATVMRGASLRHYWSLVMRCHTTPGFAALLPRLQQFRQRYLGSRLTLIRDTSWPIKERVSYVLYLLHLYSVGRAVYHFFKGDYGSTAAPFARVGQQ